MSFQPNTPRPQKVNEDPRIAINGLMKYMDATPSQREAIIRDQKFPPPFKVTWYDAACEAASRFAAGGFSDPAIVSDALSRLRSSVPSNDNEQLKNGLNIEALESLLSSFDLVDLRGLVTSPGANVTPALMLSGVVVNVRPEIELRGTYRKEPTAGAIKFYFSKPTPLTEEMGRYGAVLVMRHQETVVGETASVRKKSCMVYDVFGSRVWAAPANSTARLRDLEAACREIAQRWPSITLNPRPE